MVNSSRNPCEMLLRRYRFRQFPWPFLIKGVRETRTSPLECPGSYMKSFRIRTCLHFPLLDYYLCSSLLKKNQKMEIWGHPLINVFIAGSWPLGIDLPSLLLRALRIRWNWQMTIEFSFQVQNRYTYSCLFKTSFCLVTMIFNFHVFLEVNQ